MTTTFAPQTIAGRARRTTLRAILSRLAGALARRHLAGRTRALLADMDERQRRDILADRAFIHRGAQIAANARMVRELANQGW